MNEPGHRVSSSHLTAAVTLQSPVLTLTPHCKGQKSRPNPNPSLGVMVKSPVLTLTPSPVVKSHNPSSGRPEMNLNT